MATLIVVTGSMFSGKSEELIRRLKRQTYARRTVLAIKPGKDTRAENVVSRSKGQRGAFEPSGKFVAYAVNSEEELRKLMAEQKPDVLGVDEAQFFPPWMLAFIRSLLETNADVLIVVAGLDMDAWGEPFGIMPQLMAIADQVIKEKAVCFVCGSEAGNMSQKKSPGSGGRIEVGDAELYEARCRKCWSPPEMQ